MSELDDSLCIHQLYSPLHAGGLLHNDVLPYDLVGDGPELYAGVLDQLVPLLRHGPELDPGVLHYIRDVGPELEMGVRVFIHL